MTSVVEVVVDVGILGLAVGMVLALYRMMKGPHLADRAIAGDLAKEPLPRNVQYRPRVSRHTLCPTQCFFTL